MTFDEDVIQRFVAPPVLRHGDADSADWEAADPVAAGFAPDFEGRLTAWIRDGNTPGLHGLVVVRGGRLVLEHYGEGADFSWGMPYGQVRFAPDTLHDVRSATKSVIALLYGIALAEGTVPEPEDALLSQFPEYPELADAAATSELTVEHALTMTLGIDWGEDVPYTDPANGEIAMMIAPDRWRYVLQRPVIERPGTRWTYCGGATELLGRLIAKGTATPLPEYAHRVLFEPIGIGRFEWLAGHDRVASSASGLRLTPRDLARIGQLVLAGGRWGGRQVVPGHWLSAALHPRVEAAWGDSYGYQWYAGGAGPHRWVGANGNGDQRLYVVPELDVVVAITAGNYDGDQGWMPRRLLNEVILPGLG